MEQLDMEAPRALGVLSVATNIYIDYWRNMVLSLDDQLRDGEQIAAHVFTDQPEKAFLIQAELIYVKVYVHTIPSYRWPDATIRRYEIFSQFASEIKEKVLMHLDADMLVLQDFYEEIISTAQKNKMMLVAHPGFWKKSPSLKQKISNLLFGLKPKNGSWENRKESRAFVAPTERKQYVCGGVWAGNREIFFELTDLLGAAVLNDRNKSVIAVWHDESHLNKWSSENDYVLLTPKYCFVEEYKHLESLNPVILAVTKDLRTR